MSQNSVCNYCVGPEKAPWKHQLQLRSSKSGKLWLERLVTEVHHISGRETGTEPCLGVCSGSFMGPAATPGHFLPALCPKPHQGLLAADHLALAASCPHGHCAEHMVLCWFETHGAPDTRFSASEPQQADALQFPLTKPLPPLSLSSRGVHRWTEFTLGRQRDRLW